MGQQDRRQRRQAVGGAVKLLGLHQGYTHKPNQSNKIRKQLRNIEGEVKMDKGSEPPVENNQMQQGMPSAPPSYNESMVAGASAGPAGAGAGTAGGFIAPPPEQDMKTRLVEGFWHTKDQIEQKLSPAPVAAQPPVQVVTQIQYVQAPTYGFRPVQMTCPHCQTNITTHMVSEPSAMSWILGGVLCLVGLWPCSCVPCLIDSMQQVTHSCPKCKNFLGRYKGGL